MGAPWEKYQNAAPTSAPSGPWDKYKSTEPTDLPHPLEAYQKPDPTEGVIKRYTRGALESAPGAGAMVGGALGAGAAGVGALPGAMMGGMAGKAVKEVGLGLMNQGTDYLKPQMPTMAGTAKGVESLGWGGVEGAAQELFGAAAGKVLNKASSLMKAGYKDGYEAMMAAAERLGIKPTAGMASNSKVVQGLESSLEQSPSLAGAATATKTEPVRQGLISASKDVLSEGAGSKYSSGVNAAKGVTSKLGEDYANIQMAYEPFNKEMPKMIPHAEDMHPLYDKVAEATKNTLSLGNNVAGYGEQVSNALTKAKSLGDVETIRKQVGQSLKAAYRAGDQNVTDAISKVYDHLSDFRDAQFVKLAKEANPQGGTQMGKGMVQEFEAAQDGFRKLMAKLEDVGPALGIKNKNPQAFMDAINDMPPEKLAKTLFKKDNLEAALKIQEHFPEAFDAVRKLEIQKISDASIGPKGEVSVQKMLNQVEKLEPEYQKLLFGKKVSKIDDIRTLADSYPQMMGPSGTPQGEMFKNVHKPFFQAGEGVRYGIYKTAASPRFQAANEAVNQFSETPAASGLLGGVGQLGKQGLIKGYNTITGR